MKDYRYTEKRNIFRHISAAALILFLMAGIFFAPAGYCADEETADGEALKCHSGTFITPIGNPGAEPPSIKARAAAMYSLDMNTFVYEKNPEQIVEPYSTTKLLTCWLALENLDQDKVVTVSEAATQVYENGTTIWLKPGENITVRDLLYGALLESGNDAAYALGEAVSGSEKDFAELMNTTVAGWGCESTSFVNANGWKARDHYTTAHDMAIITAKCLENEELRKISTTKKYTIPETNLSPARELKNYFLQITGNPEGLTGGKTGTWDTDDCGVVLSFQREGLEAVIVVLGDTEKSRAKDVRKLMTFSHEVTPGFAVPAEGSIVETAWVKHGERTRADLTTAEVTYAYPAGNTPNEITTEAVYDKLEAPLKKGDVVGKFQIYSGDKLIGTQKLLMAEDVDTGWLPSYIYIPDKITKIILGVIGGLIVLILLLRMINKSRSRRRRRKRIKERAEGRRESAQTTQSQPSQTVSTQNTSTQRSSAQKQSSQKQSSANSRKDKKEARKRLREKYRGRH